MKYSKNIVSTYTRRVKVKSSPALVETFSTSIETATKLYNFTLSYMQKLYGKNHIDRYIPRGQAQNYITNSIKSQFLENFYNGGKWSQKETNLNSQSANYIIEETILHFRKYRNKLFGYSQMTEDQKLELKNNKKKNPNQKSWYRMYGLSFKREESCLSLLQKKMLWLLFLSHMYLIMRVLVVETIERQLKNLEFSIKKT